jgi:hypothetical protein
VREWCSGLAALTFTDAATDPEVFDRQQALVGRLGGLVVTAPTTTRTLARMAPVLQPPDLSGAVPNRYGIRFRRPEICADSTRLITGVIDAEHAYAAGLNAANQA